MSEIRLIDAAKIDYIFQTCRSESDLAIGLYEQILDIEPTLTIPENPTFGEVITALIPIEDMWNSYHIGVGKEVCVKFKGCEYVTSFDADYWNAPYKRGNTDGSNNN